MEGLQDRWRSVVRLDGLAEFGETTGEGRFTDKGLRPTLLQQFRLAHDPVSMLEEVEKDLKHLGLNRHRASRTPQLTARLIEGVVVKAVDHITRPPHRVPS
jgi:hypothetical protein